MESNKKMIYIYISMIVIFVILMVFLIIFIWMPKKTNSNMHSYADNVTDFKERTVKLYSDEIVKLFYPRNIEKLYNKLDDDFKEKYNITKDNLADYLKSEDMYNTNVVLDEYYVGSTDETYIYILKMSFYGLQKTVTVYETKPHEYTISLDQDDEIESKNLATSLSKSVDNIDFEFNITSRTEKSIKYSIKITNNNDFDVEFNITNSSNILLIMSDGGQVKPTNSFITSDSSVLKKDSSFTNEFNFNVTVENQGLIAGMLFENVKYNGETRNIQVLF